MIETNHAKFDHLERHLDINDVLHGLKKNWTSSHTDQFDKDEWQWRYAIKTEDVEGHPLTIIISVDSLKPQFQGGHPMERLINTWSLSTNTSLEK